MYSLQCQFSVVFFFRRNKPYNSLVKIKKYLYFQMTKCMYSYVFKAGIKNDI